MTDSSEVPAPDPADGGDAGGGQFDTSEWREHAERAAAWFANEDRAKVRRAAKVEIKRRITAVVEPHGFVPAETGTGWVYETWSKESGIFVQYARAGDRCYINLSRQRRLRFLPRSPQGKDVIRLGRFYERPHDRVGDAGSLFYYDITDFPEYVDDVMEVIAHKAIPWLKS